MKSIFYLFRSVSLLIFDHCPVCWEDDETLLLYHLSVRLYVPSVWRPSLLIARYLATCDCKELANIVKISNHVRPSLPHDHFHISQNWSNLFPYQSDKENWPLVVSKNADHALLELRNIHNQSVPGGTRSHNVSHWLWQTLPVFS